MAGLEAGLRWAQEMIERLKTGVTATVQLHEETLVGALAALISGGHLLIEGVPGLGKTLLARTLAVLSGGQYNRVQFTPDLLPSDITGHVLYDMKSGEFKMRRGPISATSCWPMKSTARRPRPRPRSSKPCRKSR